MRVSITSTELILDGTPVSEAQPLRWFEERLGQSARTTVPEIAKRRPDLSNKIHVFDSLGITLNEHHAHRRCYEVLFALVADEAPFPPNHPFSGELSVLGHPISGGETEAELLGRGLQPTESFVHGWTFDAGAHVVGIDFRRLRDARTGKRTGPHRLAVVTFDFLTPEDLQIRSSAAATET
jgi:hypothetical protein